MSPDTSTAGAKSNVEKAGTSKVPVNTPTVKPPTIVNNLNPDGTVKGASLNGGSAGFQPKQPQTAPVVTATAKDVQNSAYTKSPLQVVADAVTPKLTPLLPVANQNAFKDKANNLSIDTGTGKTTPAKNPVAMPDVTWGKPTQVVTMSPLVAKLPQYKAVATFVPDGDTFSAKSDSYATKGEKAKKAGGILCRVDSVDAPETPHLPYKRGQPYGEEAGKKLQQMILNKEISIRIVEPANGDPNEVGHYGRDICQIEVSGANVSTELIRSGAAWLYKEYNNYFTGLEAVEADAQANQRGLFGLPNPVYPPTAKHSGSLNLQ
jgi:endonuclease YncB( thermonuclease family)